MRAQAIHTHWQERARINQRRQENNNKQTNKQTVEVKKIVGEGWWVGGVGGGVYGFGLTCTAPIGLFGVTLMSGRVGLIILCMLNELVFVCLLICENTTKQNKTNNNKNQHNNKKS